MQLSLPSHPGEGLTIDFVTHLPQSIAVGSTGIVLIVDCFTAMFTYLTCRKDIDSPVLEQMFLKHVIYKCGMPDNITTDCRTEYSSRF